MRTTVWTPRTPTADTPLDDDETVDYMDCAAAVGDEGELSIFAWPSRLVIRVVPEGEWNSFEVEA